MWPGTIFGWAMHEILEKAILMKRVGESVQKIKSELLHFPELYDKVREEKGEEEGFVYKETRNSYRELAVEKGVRLAPIFLAYVLGRFLPDNEYFPEFGMEVVADFDEDIILRGTTDLLIKSADGRYFIVDFKTSKLTKWFFVDWEKDLQSQMYTTALTQMGQEPESFEYLVLQHSMGIILSHKAQLKKSWLRYLRKEIKEYKKRHLNPQWEYFSPGSFKCTWCEYSRVCPKSQSTKVKNQSRLDLQLPPPRPLSD